MLFCISISFIIYLHRIKQSDWSIAMQLHTPPLNTMNYLHEVVDISRGRRPSEIFTTEGR